MLSVGKIDVGEPLLVSSSSDINGSVLIDTIVQENCSLHVRGNILGNLTIEPGATVVVEGSVDGRILNRGGSLVVNNKGPCGLRYCRWSCGSGSLRGPENKSDSHCI